MQPPLSFRENPLYRRPIRDLLLQIEGTRLESVIREFEQELTTAGICALKPRYHLSTDWGVAFGSITIGIPFYLAKPELTALHGEEVGHIEGFDRRDLLRYLRHEMGHVVNYAYQLFEREDWIKLFGSITQPYEEDYRPQPFSLNFVWHLPGWYAQKHPDEDWAETFAVWMTPGSRWRDEYRGTPGALAKLNYCDERMRELGNVPPIVAVHELDEDVGELSYSLANYYERLTQTDAGNLAGLDGALRAIFLDPDEWDPQGVDAAGDPAAKARAADLIRRVEQALLAEVYRWTGHFPERTKLITRQLISQAAALDQWYVVAREAEIVVGLTTYVCSLAMNFVHHGSYFPALKK
jgi:hypothetical protein